ncbi:hypothetical protein ABIB73_000097 [Bradyrhizobium sp. F1.4.3]|uniref:hypothetical protein n=1 Tax=Bradyrhizobium sp. F1.4.3 TaxID=3156356 RepID=UPI003394F491
MTDDPNALQKAEAAKQTAACLTKTVRDKIDAMKVMLAPHPLDERRQIVETAMSELRPEPHVVVPPPQ